MNKNSQKNIVFRRNFDYGEGFYANMDKYKDLASFRKKQRKAKMNKRRLAMLEILTAKPNTDKNNLQDTLESQVTEMPWSPEEPCGPLGMLDGIYPQEDLDAKPVTNLYYGRLDNHYVDDKKKK